MARAAMRAPFFCWGFTRHHYVPLTVKLSRSV
jgi:hypothetical protein